VGEGLFEQKSCHDQQSQPREAAVSRAMDPNTKVGLYPIAKGQAHRVA
jgi:hypothetical protein